MLRILVVLACILVLGLPAVAQQTAVDSSLNAVPNLTGTWKLDRDLTTADLSRVKTDTIIVNQSFEAVRIEYYDRERRRFGVENFITDGFERQRYVSRIERAYAKAKWKDDRLVIMTRSFLDVLGYQSYDMVESWERSSDGRTLTNKSSDGKTTVYNRISSR